MSERRPEIAFDIDGVLARTDREILRQLQERGYCQASTEHDITDFYFEKCLPGVNQALIQTILGQPGFYQRLLPCRHLKQAFDSCREDGYKVHLCTARREYDTCRVDTMQWLCDYEFQPDSLTFIRSEDRREWASQNQIDLFIEDRLDNAQAISLACPVVLVAMPYNSMPALDPRILRVSRESIAFYFPGIVEDIVRYGSAEILDCYAGEIAYISN